jgi:hypothetical protein
MFEPVGVVTGFEDIAMVGEAVMTTDRREPAAQVTTVAFYIDADNQSSQCVKALIVPASR